MNVKINENSLRQVIRRQLLQESMEEELFKTVRNKPGQQRQLVTQEQFLETMANLPGNANCAVCFGYIDGVNLKKDYMVQKRNPATNRMKGFPDIDKIKQELNSNEPDVVGIIKASIRVINWQSSVNYGKDYEKYVNSVNAIRSKLNADHGWNMRLIQRDENPKYRGDRYVNRTFELPTKNSSNSQYYGMQNDARPLYKNNAYYMINSNGDIVGKELSDAEFGRFVQERPVDGESALRKLTSDESIINQYINDLKDLRHSPRRFRGDGFVFLVATINVDGEKRQIVYINDLLKNEVEGVKINPAVFQDLAMNRYSKGVQVLNTINTDSGLHDLDRAKATRDFDNIYKTIKTSSDKQQQTDAGAINEVIKRILKQEIYKLH